jgi:hypothetical protein
LEEGKEVVIEGWLKKKGRMSRMWKNRWFWLYDGKLFYDKQAHSTTARGYITVLDVLQVTAQTNVWPKPNVCRHRRRASSARPSRRLRADDRLRRLVGSARHVEGRICGDAVRQEPSYCSDPSWRIFSDD